MKTSDFNFELPDELIARYPLKQRSQSRLLHLSQNEIEHRIFSDLPLLLRKNDVLILNDTRVIPARLYAQKKTGARVEILIERFVEQHEALAQIKANKSLKLPCTLYLSNKETVTVLEQNNGFFRLRFNSTKTIREILADIGKVPLPKYMQRLSEESDKERYQTVYAKQEGAVAAPTAGLHFDHALLEQLKENGIQCGFVTLHVGAGTFKPVRVENIVDHEMHHEVFDISPEVCELINTCKKSGGRIIAVGTTTVRALETAMQNKTHLTPCTGETNIFIYPGFRFQCIDGLITNFHLPKSTLLMLVCAFGGYKEVMNSYSIAINERYRFYSYGDAMFIANLQHQRALENEV